MFTQQSMQFNGEYFENLIAGYTTISVSGRESLDVAVESKTVGNRDGSIYKHKRYESRTLLVSFAIEGIERADLIQKLNTLNGILNTSDEATIVVDDEPDVFYNGTRSGSADFNISLAPGTGNAVATGTFEIFCADGFKYSIEEFEVEGETVDDGVMFSVDYNGTQKSYPRFETDFYSKLPEVSDDNMDDTSITGVENESLDHAGECSYVAFYNDNEKILQFGDPDMVYDIAGTTIPKSQTLINQEFRTTSGWGEAAQKDWTLNSGFNIESGNWLQQGVLGTGYPKYNTPSVTTSGIVMSKVNTSSSLSPKVSYSVTYTAGTRREDSVKLTLSINASVPKGASYGIPKGVGLTAYFAVNGSEHSKKIKQYTAAWTPGKTYTTTWTITVRDIQDTELQDLKNCRFAIGTSFNGIKSFDTKTSYSKGSIVRYNNGNYYRATSSVGKGKWNSSKWDNIGKLAYLTSRTVKTITIPTYIEPGYGSYYLTPYSYGDDQKNKTVGPTMIRDVPLDASSDKGANDFSFTWKMKMSIGKDTNDVNHRGAFQVLVLTEVPTADGTSTEPAVLAGFIIDKRTKGSKGTVTKLYNQSYHTIPVLEFGKQESSDIKIDLSYGNKFVGHPKTARSDLGACSITKSNSMISMNIGSLDLGSVVVPPELKAYKIQFGFFKQSGYPVMDHFGIFNCKFTKNECNTNINVLNPFTAAGRLEADTASANIFLDGNRRPELGAIGNDWEDMCLIPGTNNIGASYSLIDPSTTTVFRKCTQDDAYAGQYMPVFDLEEADFNANKHNFWIMYSDVTYAQCGDADIFDPMEVYYQKVDDYITYYTSEHTVSDPQPSYDLFSSQESSYYIEDSCAPKFKMFYREVFV